MDYIMTERLERHYKLLTLLLRSVQPQSKSKLAGILNCSRPTLNTTVTSANKLIKKHGEIITSAEGLELKLYQNFSQRQLRGIIIQQTLIFTFLNELFFTVNLSVNKWSALKYVSKSSAYKYRLEIENYLALIDLKLVNSKEEGMYLIGKEWQIRYLYLQLLKDVFLLDGKWPFADLDFLQTLDIVKEICALMGIYIGPILERQYALFIGIHIQRYKLRKKKYPPQYELSKDKLAFFQQNKKMTKVLNRLEILCLMKLPDVERGMIIMTAEIFPTYFLSKEAMNRRLEVIKSFHSEAYHLALDCMVINNQEPNDQSIDFLKYVEIFLPLMIVPYFQETSLEYFQSKKTDKFVNFPQIGYFQKVQLIERRMAKLPNSGFFKRNRKYVLTKLNQLYRSSRRSLQQENPVLLSIVSHQGPAQEERHADKLRAHLAGIAIKIMPSQEVYLTDMWRQIDLFIGDFKVMNLIKEDQFVLVDDELTKRSLLDIERRIKVIIKNRQT